MSLGYVLEEKADDIHVLGTATNGIEAVKLARELHPDVILMDVRMPEMDGVEATRRILADTPEVKILMLTTFDDDEYVHDALNCGAVGYVLKNVPPDNLMNCIRAAQSGLTLLSPDIARKLNRGPISIADLPRVDPQFEQLTPRERDVLQLILKAYDNRSIARRLTVSDQTVKNYIHSVYEKLGVSGRTELIQRVLNEVDSEVSGNS
jgi:DNA-binding NarL/FixJ family response regulator